MELHGAKELMVALDRLDRNVQRSVESKAARQTVKPVLMAARTNARDLRDATGDLAESLKIAVKRKGDVILASVVAGKKKRSRRQLEKIASGKRRLRKRRAVPGGVIDAYYAHLVEAGHQASGWYAGQAGAVRVPAHPFLSSAWDAIGDERLNQDFQERLGGEIEKVWAA